MVYIKNKKILYFVAIVLGLIVFVVSFLIASKNIQDGQDLNSPATVKQKEQGEFIKDTSLKNDGTSGSDMPPAPVQNLESSKSTVEMSITSSNKVGSFYMIRSMISVPDQQGSCTLILSRDGQNTITKTVGVQPQAQTSTCQGFNVKLDEIPIGGEWELRTVYSSDKYKGVAFRMLNVEK